MKIICISTSSIPAPTAHSMQMMKVCHALGQLGNQVELIVPSRVIEKWEVLAKHYGLAQQFNIRYERSRAVFKRYDFTVTSIHYAHRQKPDLVYTWLLPAAVMALRSDLPVVLELHDRVTGTAAPWLFKQLLESNRPKRLAIITKALVGILKQEFPNYSNDIDSVVAPNGVELERYKNLPSARSARKKLGLPEKLTVVYSGGFYEGRGIELLHYLARHNPEIQFIWAGGTPTVCRQWQAKLETEKIKNVHITGFVNNSDLPLYQAAGEILAMPFGKVIAGSSGGNSAEICSPMKMFDYLASGRAIMATNLPVLKEVLDDKNAVLLPPDDYDVWQKALTLLAGDEKIRRALGNQARKDANRYTWLGRETSILKGFPPR